MAFDVVVDTAALRASLRQLSTGLDRATDRAARDTADGTARRIAAGVPVLSGALRATVEVSAAPNGASVHYGGELRYAQKIERRVHAVALGIAGAPADFERAMTDEAHKEVARL